ncbi:MAG: hypothetical protein K2X00_11050 [Nitrospiraceae bacterium]|nr:hypothetical protein [Nitrospiraceae bacterium]
MARYTKTIREDLSNKVLLTHLHIESGADHSSDAATKYSRYVTAGGITADEAARVVSVVVETLNK